MKKYIYQKFLLNCEYETISIEDFLFDGNVSYIQYLGTSYNLLDVNVPFIRKIEISNIDDIIDEQEDWDEFLSYCKDLDCLVMVLRKCDEENPIISAYREATLKAYIFRLQVAGIKVMVAESVGEVSPLFFNINVRNKRTSRKDNEKAIM